MLTRDLVPGSDSEKEEPPEPVIPDQTVYLIAGFVLCLVVGSLVFMAYVMITESGAHPISSMRHAGITAIASTAAAHTLQLEREVCVCVEETFSRTLLGVRFPGRQACEGNGPTKPSQPRS